MEDEVPEEFFTTDPFYQGPEDDGEENRSFNSLPHPAEAEVAWHRKQKYQQRLAQQSVREQGNRYF